MVLFLRNLSFRGIFLGVLCSVVFVGEMMWVVSSANTTIDDDAPSYIDCPGLDTVGNGCCDADNNIPECGESTMPSRRARG